MTILNLMKKEEFSKQVENTVGKGRNCSIHAIPPFPAVFPKDLYCRHVKTRACLGKDYIEHTTCFCRYYKLRSELHVLKEQREQEGQDGLEGSPEFLGGPKPFLEVKKI